MSMVYYRCVQKLIIMGISGKSYSAFKRYSKWVWWDLFGLDRYCTTKSKIGNTDLQSRC
jgi:hypothetical protein